MSFVMTICSCCFATTGTGGELGRSVPEVRGNFGLVPQKFSQYEVISGQALIPSGSPGRLGLQPGDRERIVGPSDLVNTFGRLDPDQQPVGCRATRQGDLDRRPRRRQVGRYGQRRRLDRGQDMPALSIDKDDAAWRQISATDVVQRRLDKQAAARLDKPGR